MRRHCRTIIGVAIPAATSLFFMWKKSDTLAWEIVFALGGALFAAVAIFGLFCFLGVRLSARRVDHPSTNLRDVAERASLEARAARGFVARLAFVRRRIAARPEWLIVVVAGLLLIVLPCYALIKFAVAPAPMTPKLALSHGASLLLSFLAWGSFSYHYIVESRRQRAFPAALDRAIALVEKIDTECAGATVSDANQFKAALEGYISGAREVLLSMRPREDDPSLSVWAFEPRPARQHLRVLAIAHSPKISTGALSQVKAKDISPMFCRVAGKDSAAGSTLSYGSLSARALLEASGASGSDVHVNHEKNANRDPTYLPSHLDYLKEEVRPHFLGLSHLRAVVGRAPEGDSADGNSERCLALFAAHSRRSYFTDYDRCLFGVIVRGLSRFVVSSPMTADSLRKVDFLPVEREFLQCRVGTRFNDKWWIETSTESRRRRPGRVPVHLKDDIAERGRRTLDKARAYTELRWEVVDLINGSSIGVEYSQLGPNEHPAKTLLDEAEANGYGPAVDVLWARRACQSARKRSERLFLKMRWATIADPLGATLIQDVCNADLPVGPPVLVVQNKGDLSEDDRKRLISDLKRWNVEVCVDAVWEVREADLAHQLGAAWIKVPVHVVDSAVADPANGLPRLMACVRHAKQIGLQVIVPGVKTEACHNGFLQFKDVGSGVFLEGSYFANKAA